MLIKGGFKLSVYLLLFRMCPIFQVSNVSGENMDLLKMFLNLLSTRLRCNLGSPAEFQIDDTFSVPGVGTVVSGTLLQGYVKLNDTLMLGPDPLGQFQPMVIKSIHRKRMPVKEVRGGQTASFALKKVTINIRSKIFLKIKHKKVSILYPFYN
jgi:GTPase